MSQNGTPVNKSPKAEVSHEPAAAHPAAVDKSAEQEASHPVPEPVTPLTPMTPHSPKYFPIALSWDSLSYSVGDKHILKGLSGQALPNRTLAIMGSSGAGKTTFLNAISDRLETDRQKKLTGIVRLNEINYQRKHRKLFGFVPQDDIVGAMATPTTALSFALRIRRGVDVDEVEPIVTSTLEELRLTHVKDTRVGIPGVVQGLSGGERKRCNIGVELIADTKVLLLDEPTSGLDSNTAAKTLQTLQEIARRGRTVVFTVHQPTSEMLATFDDLMLMAGGKVAYHGPVEGAVHYFEAAGYKCPSTYTPTDYYMTLLQNTDIAPILTARWDTYLHGAQVREEIVRRRAAAKSNDAHGNNNSANRDLLNEEAVVSAGPGSAIASPATDGVSAEEQLAVVATLQPVPACVYTHDGHMSGADDYCNEYLRTTGSSFAIQVVELTKRSFYNVFHNVSFIAMILVQSVFFAIVAGVIFVNLKDTVTGVQDRIGLLFMVTTNKGFGGANIGLHSFKPERPLFVREQQAGSYSVLVYYLANFFSQLPILALGQMLEAIIIYFVAGLVIDAAGFFTFYAILLSALVTSSSIGTTVGALVSDEAAAAATVPMLMIPMMLVCGLLASNDQIRPYWIWLEKISFMRYTFVVLAHNEFDKLGTISCDPGEFGAQVCNNFAKNGPEALASVLDFAGDQDQPWIMWVCMAAMFIIVRTIGYLALVVVGRSKF